MVRAKVDLDDQEFLNIRLEFKSVFMVIRIEAGSSLFDGYNSFMAVFFEIQMGKAALIFHKLEYFTVFTVPKPGCYWQRQ